MTTDDRELVHRFIAEGDDSAFEELVVKYQRDLVGFFLRLARNRMTAEDLAQETFVKAYSALKKGGEHTSFAPLLFRIAKFIWYSELRRRYRRPKMHGRISDYKELLPSDSPDPARSAGEERDFSEVLKEALGELKADHRLIIEMAYFLDMPYKDIAEALDIPMGTVKSRLNTAVRKLREVMHRKGYSR